MRATGLHRVLAAALFAMLLCGCQRGSRLQPVRAAEDQGGGTGPTVIQVSDTPLHTGVKRLGINLSGQTFYDSGQMLRNVTFRNPGFEGETWQSILHCKSVGPLTCHDENQYAVWPDGFMNGASFEVLSGRHMGQTGQVAGSLAASGSYGVTLNLAPGSPALEAGDFVLVRSNKPGDAQVGWWPDLKGGATLGTEFRDLSARSPGRQALRIEAGAPGASAAVSSFFDSYEGRSFLQLRGTYTLQFRAKSIIGSRSLNVRLERLDTAHGLHSFFNQAIQLTPAWQDYTYTITANEARTAVGTVGLTFSLAGGTALLDDAALTAAAAPDNPTAFRNEVVATLRDLRPGVLRYMDNGTDFGSSLDNMLAVPFARVRAGASEQEKVHEEIPLGLHEFLTLCAAVGAEPWYAMPAGTSPREAAELAEYLAGDAATPYGARRAALGQKAPWTSVFPVIHLELGNEQWNQRSFAGSTINDPKAFARRASAVYAPLHDPRFDLILGSWATVPWWTGEELSNASNVNTVAMAPYQLNDFNDSSSVEAVFGPMFAEPELIDSRPGGYMAQQLAAAQKHSAQTQVAVYEVNLGLLSGSAPEAALSSTAPSFGAGLAVADHMLLMLRDLGVTTQCLFALPEYSNDFTRTGGGHEKVLLWGSVVDMGGATDNRRPQFLTVQLANQAILPTMLTTRITGTPQLWDQVKSPNGGIEGKGLHLLQSFAFADGAHRSLIVLNLSRTQALPVSFGGTAAPRGPVQMQLLHNQLTANNEIARNVAVETHQVDSFDPARSVSLPPASMTVLTWGQGQPRDSVATRVSETSRRRAASPGPR